MFGATPSRQTIEILLRVQRGETAELSKKFTSSNRIIYIPVAHLDRNYTIYTSVLIICVGHFEVLPWFLVFHLSSSPLFTEGISSQYDLVIHVLPTTSLYIDYHSSKPLKILLVIHRTYRN